MSRPPGPRLRYYVAASLDGCIATPDGGVDWLRPYQQHDYGFRTFMAEIGGAFLGRATFDKSLALGPWPLRSTPTVVMTSRPLQDAPDGVEPREGDVAAAYQHLAARVAEGDIWLLGGGGLAAQCLDAGLLDEVELYAMPVVLGDGLPLFGRTQRPIDLRLVTSTPLAGGVVRSIYRRSSD